MTLTPQETETFKNL